MLIVCRNYEYALISVVRNVLVVCENCQVFAEDLSVAVDVSDAE